MRLRRDRHGNAVPQQQVAAVVLLEPLRAFADRRRVRRDLLEGLGVHEVEERAVVVHVLVLGFDDVGALEGVA
ncbi:hypothetical protein D3C83_89500 [compost metagenome]